MVPLTMGTVGIPLGTNGYKKKEQLNTELFVSIITIITIGVVVDRTEFKVGHF